MRLMVLDYKDPITRFYMEWRKDPSCTTIYGFYTQDFTVSIFLIYRRFWIDKLQGSATATLHYVIVKFLLGHEFPNSFLLFRMHKRAQLRIPICSPPPTVNACGLWALNAKFVIPTRQCLTRLRGWTPTSHTVRLKLSDFWPSDPKVSPSDDFWRSSFPSLKTLAQAKP